MVEVVLPTTGPADPPVQYTYSSRAASQGIYVGIGWADRYNPAVSAISSTEAYLIRGRGEAYKYTGKDGSGKYLPSSTVQNSLVLNGDGTWTETQPDNLQFVYDTSGNFARMVSPAGGRWTVVRSSGLMTALAGPLSRRTTFAYDGSSKLKRVLDAGGRITTFTVNPGKDLRRVTWPDTTITTILYNASHPAATVSPRQRQPHHVRLQQQLHPHRHPAPHRRPLPYSLDGTTTSIIEPNGARTTQILGSNRNLNARIDALGNRITFVWDSNQVLTALVDPMSQLLFVPSCSAGLSIATIPFFCSWGQAFQPAISHNLRQRKRKSHRERREIAKCPNLCRPNSAARPGTG